MRFAMFVDGSNLYGSLRSLSANVHDYRRFFAHVFHRSVEVWRNSLYDDYLPAIELRRVYWYGVGEMDEWDLNDKKTTDFLREQFELTRTLKTAYLADVNRQQPGLSGDRAAAEAWRVRLTELREWYEQKRETLDKINRFHYSVQRDTDFVEIITTARWKVDFLNMTVVEKGLDTALAVDMVAKADNYDVGLVISGDADMIPSINYVKSHNKVVGVVDFLAGAAPDKKGKQSSSHLKRAADFVVPIYQGDIKT